jgi:hypothetical protein
VLYPLRVHKDCERRIILNVHQLGYDGHWTLPQPVDIKISVKYTTRGENDGKTRQRTAGIHQGI